MKMLSIDASGKTAAAAVTENGALKSHGFADLGLTHSQTLLPLIDGVLKSAGVDISEIDEFAFTAGPGSFTGLRIGAALMMGLAGDRPCRAVSTLEALAYNMIGENCVVFPVMDARRSQVYTARFEAVDDKLIRFTDDCAMPLSELEAQVRASRGRQTVILGDGAYLFEGLRGELESLSIPQGESLYTQGLGVARAAEHVKPLGAEKIKLNYLRMPQAERQLKERTENESKHRL